jgi:cytoskeletal protein RodZ
MMLTGRLRTVAIAVGVVLALVLAWVLGRATRPDSNATPTVSSTPVTSQTPTPTPTPTPSTGPTSVSPSSTPSTSATPHSAVEAGLKKDFGYAKSTSTVDGWVHVEFDRALLYTGSAANSYAAGHGMQTPVPNDYVVVNDSHKLRDLVLSPTVTITGNVHLTGNSNPSKVSLATFLSKVKADPNIPLHVTFDSQLLVTSISEQFFP